MTDNRVENGFITRLYIENFMTYHKVVVKPGRYLNLIIGPNGSGKSAIICAIVLGLGGRPNILGRATTVGEYVRNGCSEAKIEIQLKKNESEDVTVTRTFNSSGKSIWMINGSVCSAKMIHELTSSFNIQIDNLCQFLPQDRVQEFSKMNSQELLENTERSVGNERLIECHRKLKEYRSEYKKLDSSISSNKKLLESTTQKYDDLKEIVRTIKERKVIKNKIVALKQKKAWIIYNTTRKQLVEAKKTRDEAAKQMKLVETNLRPIDAAISKLKSDIQTFKTSINDHNSKIFAKNSQLIRIIEQIVDLDKDVKESESECKRRIEVEKNRDQEIRNACQRKEKLDNDLTLLLEEHGSEENLKKRQQEISGCVEKHRNVVDELTQKCTGLRFCEEKCNTEIRALELDLRSNDIEAQRLKKLRELSNDAYKGVLWLRENRERFSKPVHESMLLSMNVTHPSYVKHLENHLPIRDMIAFVCEDKQDANLLLRYLRDQQRLQINVVHSDPNKNIRMHSNIPIENIRKYGFTHYLASFIEAPPAVLKYLISMYSLNNVPVGTDAIENHFDDIPDLHCFYSKRNMFVVNVSKYTGEKSTRISQIAGNGSLSIVLDRSKLKKIEQCIQALQEKKLDVQKSIKEMEEKLRQENEKLEKSREQKSKYQQDIQHVHTLQYKIKAAQKEIEDLENERTSIDELKKSSIEQIQDILRKQLNTYRQYNAAMKEHFECVVACEKIKRTLKMKQHALVSQENDAQNLREQLSAAERTFKDLDTQLQPLKNETNRVYKEALETTGGISPADEAFKPINKAFAKLPQTVEEIHKELNIAQAKVFCMRDNMNAENVLREYEQTETDMQKLNELIERATSDLEETEQKIERLRQEWLPALTELVERINTNFSSYFAEMKCAGEVVLSQGENAMDFDEYGLKIRVKFRDTDKLQELTRHHQSGGERALTTAIYMIALQELSRVPFRCVDEINQGMDAVNERRVFELLVKMTARTNNSQYFLLTPKLLPNLQYAETVTVHCVFNGPFMVSHEEFNTDDYCRCIARNIGRN